MRYEDKKPKDPRAKGVPEQFLWYAFECLCTAGLLLEHGEMEKNPMSNWTPIAHRDMKLSNVFLGLPNETNYRRYPVPKLGGFGLAIMLPGGEVSDHDERDSPCNAPIEQHVWLRDKRGLTWPLTSKTNVWGVANIIASMVIQKRRV